MRCGNASCCPLSRNVLTLLLTRSVFVHQQILPKICCHNDLPHLPPSGASTRILMIRHTLAGSLRCRWCVLAISFCWPGRRSGAVNMEPTTVNDNHHRQRWPTSAAHGSPAVIGIARSPFSPCRRCWRLLTIVELRCAWLLPCRKRPHWSRFKIVIVEKTSAPLLFPFSCKSRALKLDGQKIISARTIMRLFILLAYMDNRLLK